MPKPFSTLPLAALALASMSAAAQAQNYSDLPPLAPMAQNQLRDLPADMRSAPVPVSAPMQMDETVTTVNGVETITRTRRIEGPRPAPASADGYSRPVGLPNPAYTQGYVPAYAPAVFERDQWIEECRRRTRGQDRDRTGLIIGGLLGGLLGSLFDGDKKKNLYDCEAALDSYLSAYGAPGGRIASRTIAYPAYDYGYGYPQAYSYGYSYAPPPQMVMVPVRTEVQQQVVVRETVREETYTVPGKARIIEPTPRPSAKMIRQP